MYEKYRPASREDGAAGYQRRPASQRDGHRDGSEHRQMSTNDYSRSLNYDDDQESHANPRGRDDHHYHDSWRGGDGAPHSGRDAYSGPPEDGEWSERGRSAAGSQSGSRRGQARSPENDGYRNRSRHSRRPNGSGRFVALDGLPNDANEDDVLEGLDDATRDRQFTREEVKQVCLYHDQYGRQTAVVEFYRDDEAERFVDRYFPNVSFPLISSRGINSPPITVGMDFDGRGRDSSRGPGRDDWECPQCNKVNWGRPVCFKCKMDRPAEPAFTDPRLTGESNVDPKNTPSQYIVVYPLEKNVTEDVLAMGVKKLFVDPTDQTKGVTNIANKLKSTAPTNSTAGLGAKPGSLRRVFLMRDRQTDASWKYGFAEFATIQDAVSAMAKFQAIIKTSRFTIASKEVSLGFAHTGVFAFCDDDDLANDSPKFFFAPITNPARQVKYWVPRAYPSVYVVSTEPVPNGPSPEKTAQIEETTLISKAPTSRPAAVSNAKKGKKEKDAPPVSKIAITLQNWQQKSAELHGTRPIKSGSTEDKIEAPTPAAVGEDAEYAQQDGPSKPHWTDQYQSYADWDKLACVVCNWEVPSQQVISDRGYSQFRREDILIDHEVRVHNHYKDADVKETAATKLAALGKEPRTITRRTPRLKSEPLPIYTSYADYDAEVPRCHLCRRNFKHIKTIWRHEQESELHKRMLSDPENIERATAELKAKGKALFTMAPNSKATQEQIVYRDRARERREAFSQPSKPAPVKGGEKRKEPTSASEPEDVPAKKSKGAGILAKMGWTSGAGLGADGAGRTEAVAAEAYVPGVGLGAEGGKIGDAVEEAARQTRGDRSDFVEKTKDKARERYEKLRD
ncbi:hypothetical protein B0H63DRAFT_456987 [Podospora didyma]|uniref:G-patch domain-containing protein n=1 Tax=Podospora didyma TaxID=330526 RepID=A0AAE0U771_9PEZI|nr:hypothetical protein B0H63DRAFT_456987 [Podospora didyma]